MHPTSLTLSKLKEETGWPGITGLGSFEVTAYVLAYYLTSMVLLTVLPGVESQGVELTSGGRLNYKLNGKRSEVRTQDASLIVFSIQLGFGGPRCRPGRNDRART